MNTLTTLSSILLKSAINVNSFPFINSKSLGIVLDTSGSAYSNGFGEGYASTAIGINPTNQNSTCLTLRNGTSQAINTTMLTTGGSFTVYFKHASRFYTDSIFGHGYALTTSATSVASGSSFTVTFYSLYPNAPYTITGVLSTDLMGASLTGTFTSNYQAITFNTSSSIASTKNMVFTCGTQSKTTTIIPPPPFDATYCVLWIDATQSLSDQTAITTTNIVDKSPTPKTVSSLGTVVYRSNGLKTGFPGFVFTSGGPNGNGIHFNVPAYTFGTTPTNNLFTFFCVYNYGSSMGLDTLCSRASSNGDNFFDWYGTGAGLPIDPSTTSGPTVFYMTISINASSQRICKNGIYNSTYSTGSIRDSTGGNAGNDNSTVFTIGGRGDNVTGMNGAISEAIAFNRVLSSTDINTIVTYLRNKWSI